MGTMIVLLRRVWGRVAGRPSAWLALVFAVDAAVAVAGAVIGQSFNLTGLLSAAPLLACARCNGRVTALVTGYALALCAIVAGMTGALSAPMQRYRFLAVLMSGVLAVFVAVIRGRRESRLIHIADRVQRAILRPLPAEVGGVAFASHYQSATPGTLVGGDLYDLTMTQFGPRLIVGDVRGKGLDAVGLCAAVIGTFRELAFAEADLSRLAQRMDAKLSDELGIEDFVTVILAEFGPGEVRLVNCGHHPPVKLGLSTAPAPAGLGAAPVPAGLGTAPAPAGLGTVPAGLGTAPAGLGTAPAGLRSAPAGLELIVPERAAPPLGLRPNPARQDVGLKQGERMLFYTDGLVEARDRAGRFLDLDGRVAAALATPHLDNCVAGVAKVLLEHTGHALADDVLLVVAEPRL